VEVAARTYQRVTLEALEKSADFGVTAGLAICGGVPLTGGLNSELDRETYGSALHWLQKRWNYLKTIVDVREAVRVLTGREPTASTENAYAPEEPISSRRSYTPLMGPLTQGVK
jgi:hypothetical protein